MNLPLVRQAVRQFAEKLREEGWKSALRRSRERIGSELFPTQSPLERADRETLFAVDLAGVRAKEKKQARASTFLHDASHVERTYPHVFQRGERFMRYALLPAAEAARGLVVYFHGHDAFLHMGPLRPWRHFDVLAPWDTFGFNRQGSWFWGEKGDNAVEQLVQALIADVRGRRPDAPWFCAGASMGGWASLYHGIKYGCRGAYVGCPQVDLRLKISDYGVERRENPYGHLMGDTLESVPDLLGLASSRDELPPLFLVQNQFDAVNPFADHGFRLLDVYNARKGWYGVRVLPAIGHLGDFDTGEAECFFGAILDKNPPGAFPLSALAKPAAGL